ncbi:MAG: hypothetical protein BECKG1743D_GA0114223_100978 [Candidatus Kentron sp. G]|nr:MAG: hypothetical protein BECKG1743E_GA0114224_100638 [Candidatus Kentron sp. G]VFM98741.1 MAG: hypothetical protein BECKG1743F_GA0114225_103413 [Candidatus Kentron sp. G]VFM99023.1 MAG: hypothetical protein BECKG1743D_GA0114223_100978 [Candidatus Kentron sp. G]
MLSDAMAIGIVFGVFAAVLFAFFQFCRSSHYIDIKDNTVNITLVFLSANAIPPFLQLIWAAIRDDPNNMPSGWRGYLAAAAVTGMWLAGGHWTLSGMLRQAFQNNRMRLTPLGFR